MRKILALILAFVLVLALGACSAPSTPAVSNPQGTPGTTGKVVTINDQQVDLAKNDIVIIKDYEGDYVDELEHDVIDLGVGEHTYTVAVFGDIVNASFMIGEMHSEAGFFGSEGRRSNQLITLNNAPDLTGELVLELQFMDCSGKDYRFSLRPDAENNGLLVIKDSGKHSANVETGRILYATYQGDGYKFIVEADESQQVQHQPVNYLYLQLDGQEKNLLTQSVDKGEDWGETIRNILNPILTPERDLVYYETDAESRTNGAGAHNHFTHRINLDTKEDRLFSSGGIHKLLTDEFHAPYGGHLVLQGHELQDGRLVPNYFLVDPSGETVCYLGTSIALYEEDLVYQIEQALK